MADLTASDVTVTQSQYTRVYPPSPYTMAYVGIEFGDGVLTYPTGGVPMPAGDLFGMKKAIGYTPPAFASGYLCLYDASTHVIKLYICSDGNPMTELGNVAVPALEIVLFVWGV